MFGIALFVFSTTLVVYAVLGYFYIVHSFTTLVSREFKRSKFVDILDKLIRIREDEENSFTVSLYSISVFSMQLLCCGFGGH